MYLSEFLNNSAALCLFGTASMSNFDDELEFRFKADTKWADAHADDKAAVIRLSAVDSGLQGQAIEVPF